jgi:hypothetical protein
MLMRKTTPRTFSANTDSPTMMGEVASAPAIGIPGPVVVCHDSDSRATFEALIGDWLANREFEGS